MKPTTGLQRGGGDIYTPDPEANLNHPNHYTWHPVAECKDVVQEFSYNTGTAIAYIWRWKRKNGVEDLKKAVKHLEFEIARQEAKGNG